MAFRINDFVSNLPGGGARSNLFEVEVTTPAIVTGSENFKFSVQATTIPGATIGVTELNYFGRAVKLAGNKTFEDWTTTIINDENFEIRRLIERWQEVISGNSSNTRGFGIVTPASYMGIGRIIQYGKGGGGIREYKIANMWPSGLAEITLDWNENDTIQTYEATWSYSHWVSEDVFDSDLGIEISTPLGNVGVV